MAEDIKRPEPVPAGDDPMARLPPPAEAAPSAPQAAPAQVPPAQAAPAQAAPAQAAPAQAAPAQAAPPQAAPAQADPPASSAGDPPPPPPPAPPPAFGASSLIGSTVSHYRILERLGGGGMGVVYRGWDLRLERNAAVKFLSPHRSSSEDFKRRFAREARTASRLEHPNICTVFETDETDDGRLFIAMAFCEGESLKRKIERGPLPLAAALAIASQVAAGLAAAHEKGVVHRDVKPGNIMVAEDGRVKIVDFGIARLADETRLTRTGDVMGTTAYISPEQFLSAETDHRTDLWSLGVVLYEMVAGRLPWSNLDERELINAIVKRPQRQMSVLRPGVPQALERVVARALAKRPADRYQRAEELRADLLAVAELLVQPATTGPYDQTLVESPIPSSGMAGRERPATAPQAPIGTPPAPIGPPPAPTGAPPPSTGPASRAGAPGEDAGAAGGAGGPASGRLAVPGAMADVGTGPSGPLSWPAAPPASGTGAASRPHGGMIGRVVAHYRILGPLGGGGMGVVYKAQDLSLERVVALKFLPPELSRDADAKTRFLQEARAASALDHPNICTIHEVGETAEDQLYLAMACYDGETLKRRLQGGPMPIDEALETAQQVARGLVKAHRHGIVHRDIKPANLMITSDEIVKILDFGIAKLAGAAGLTRIGSSLGTPGYMSPEQARGDEVDPRTDVWSLGAVLYEMVTGRRPFRGDNDQAVLYALFNLQPEPVAQLRPDAPPELVRIIGRMLAKDPDQRYLTAADALADLRALYGPVTGTGTRTGVMTGSTPLPPLPPAAAARPRRRWLGATVGVAVVAVACVAAFMALRSSGPEAAHYRVLTNLDGKETFPSIDPQGQFFVYAKEVGGRSHIFLQRVGDSEPLKDLSKDTPSNDTQPAISPDGQQIAFHSDRDGGGIFVMGLTGQGVNRRVAEGGWNPAWSPDNGEIVYATEPAESPTKHSGAFSKLYRIRVDGTERRLISDGDAVQPSWSLHNRIAYWGIPHGRGRRVIWTIPADGGTAVPAIDDNSLNWSPTWSPDGRFLYFSSDRGGLQNIWRVRIDESSGKVLDEPEAITTPSPSSGLISFSRDGHRMIYASNDSKANLESVRVDPLLQLPNGDRQPITSGAHNLVSASVSPDGTVIVYRENGPQEDLLGVHSDGTGKWQITRDRWRNRRPVWSGDGSRILFYSNRRSAPASKEKYEVWAINPDGSHLEQLTAVTNEIVADPMSSPDGRLLVCDLGLPSPAMFDLTVPLARRQPQMLPKAPGGFSAISWSTDGSRIAGVETDVVPGRLMTYSLAKRSYQVFPERGSHPLWLHDNRRLLFQANGGIYLLDTAGGTAHAVIKPTASSTFNLAGSSPDDREIYLIDSTEEGHIYLRTTD
ncbi:MAG TPA: protein kinase [Thermoanaerobaculia bacterium]|nr:protein kinase [Thermoanaerobaculia bacterium]